MSLDRSGAGPRKDEALESLRGARVSAQLAGACGRALQVEGRVRPVIGLREGAMRGRALIHQTGERLEDRSIRPLAAAALNPIDLERADLTMVERALAAWEPDGPQTGRPPLMFLPMAWSSVRNGQARKRLLRIVGAAQARLRMIPICEIYGIERGAPASVMREAVGALQPIFRGVMPRVPRGGDGAHLTDCGFTGASVEAGDLMAADDEQAVLRTVLALQRVGPAVLFHGVRSVSALAAARTAGASWASLDIAPGAQDAAGLADRDGAEKETAARSPGPPLDIGFL